MSTKTKESPTSTPKAAAGGAAGSKAPRKPKKAPGPKPGGGGSEAVRPKTGRGKAGSPKPKAKPRGGRATKGSGRGGRRRAGRGAAGGRLRPGELDGIVVGHMSEHRSEPPLTASAVAKAVGRSSGAVGNCLERLAKADGGKVRRTGTKPRAYELAEAAPEPA